jgi:hypothetical protein
VKACIACHEVKPLCDFKNRKGARDGKRNDCRRCSVARELLRRQRPEVAAQGLAVQRVRRKRNYDPELNRAKMFRWKYDISIADFDEMFAAQGGLCAICRTSPANAVDHNHVTGRVRALLCKTCNVGLGMFRDEPAFLAAAINYLGVTA